MTANATELVLVKLAAGAGPADRARLERSLSTWGANVHASAQWGWIVQLQQGRKAALSADPAVGVVGGIQPSGRSLPRIRVQAREIPVKARST